MYVFIAYYTDRRKEMVTMTDDRVIWNSIPYMEGQNQVIATYREWDEEHKDDGGIHYIMWSGGCDSTLLLYELLEAYGPERVVAISYKFPWLYEKKWETENARRNAFKAKMKARDPKYNKFRHVEMETTIKQVEGDFINANSMGLPQAVSWMLSIPVYCVSKSYIYTGAIRNDDLTLHLEGYHEMFRGISKTLAKQLYLREPLIYLTKAQVLAKCFQYGIYDDTWFCEMPPEPTVPCYECQPCKTHIAALTELSLGKKDDFVTIMATRELEKIKDEITKRRDDSNKPDGADIRNTKYRDH